MKLQHFASQRILKLLVFFFTVSLTSSQVCLADTSDCTIAGTIYDEYILTDDGLLLDPIKTRGLYAYDSSPVLIGYTVVSDSGEYLQVELTCLSILEPSGTPPEEPDSTTNWPNDSVPGIPDSIPVIIPDSIPVPPLDSTAECTISGTIYDDFILTENGDLLDPIQTEGLYFYDSSPVLIDYTVVSDSGGFVQVELTCLSILDQNGSQPGGGDNDSTYYPPIDSIPGDQDSIPGNYPDSLGNVYDDPTDFTDSTGFETPDFDLSIEIIKVFPAPAKNHLKISLNSEIEQYISVELIGLMGQGYQVLNDYMVSEGKNLVNMELFDIPAGNYIYILSGAQESLTGSIIIRD